MSATLVYPTFPAPIELRTARVLLRQWKDADFAEYAGLNADAAVRRYFPSVLDKTLSDAEGDRIRGGIAQRGWGMWAMEIPGEIPFAGFVGLNPPMFPAIWQPAVEIGWRLARRAWGKGYATEAAEASLYFAFEHMRLPEVIALSVVSNKPSHAVMERIGMTRWNGMEFDHPRVPADWPLKRHIVHRITMDTWRARRIALETSSKTLYPARLSGQKSLKHRAKT